MTDAAEQISFFDAGTRNCPYPVYRHLRDEEPVWRDPATGIWFLSRYEDVRAASIDDDRYTSRIGNAAGATEKGMRPDDPALAESVREEIALEAELARKYEEHGWPTVPTLAGLDEPEHMQRRRLFDHAFRAERIRELDPYVESLAHRLVDAFIDDGRCDFVSAFAIPLPLYVIGRQVGAREEDMPQVKRWTDAWIQRMGLTQTPDERRWSADQEIEAQQWFQTLFDRLRAQPDDTLLSELVNNEVPGLGRSLNDNELHSEVMTDLFVGGGETTTHALSSGLLLGLRNPGVWRRVTEDPDAYLERFIEEVLRLDTPIQGLLRQTSEDIELHGITIPADSVVCFRFGAANRDDRRYERAEEIDLDRDKPRSHLAFGTGSHHCLGAPLARRELQLGFRVLIERLDDIRLVGRAEDLTYSPNYFLRALDALPITFTPRT